ncbi:hypothetical protein COT54_02640 [Candidatus Collierbacteria bacterium CG09_land_8_20_14_0_10_46_12]|uniref:Resolvase/invertase-type recombinase catalytic domain-containing protein n=1 Tax=Candidatus Collierbacteria bacterium CG09_land_8_20_14_0_10_46_12 TaxID=1974533 RepID=A0A2H0WYR0_9BACT|nr:MAG: hypothetical protein COT54_02640 [Candidatus Collierbacteria bacterium CG09_land_8_20_14_0_10_46_12]
MTTACIYLRFSDDSQEGNTSFEVQEEQCREACRREEWEVYPEIIKDNAVSALSLQTKRTTSGYNTRLGGTHEPSSFVTI